MPGQPYDPLVFRTERTVCAALWGGKAYVTVKRTYPTGTDLCYPGAIAGEGRTDTEN